MTGLVLPEIVYNARKKLGCIFIENHNSEPLELKRGQTIGLVTSWVVTQSITGWSNDMNNHIGGASGGNAEKASRKAGSVQSIENRQFYEIAGENINI